MIKRRARRNYAINCAIKYSLTNIAAIGGLKLLYNGADIGSTFARNKRNLRLFLSEVYYPILGNENDENI